MIFEKTLTTLAAAAAIVAAAAVSVVAGAFAVYAVLLPLVGPAGGAAIVAAIFAVFAVIGALLMVRKADGGPSSRASAPTASQPDPFQLAERAFEMVKERPVLSAAAAIAAGVIAFRNPALVTIVAKAFMDLKQTPPR